jgi:antitoxin CptB
MSVAPSVEPAADIQTRRKRALFRAQHRGTKEMDWMIGRYAEAKLPGMDAAALDTFDQLLAISDPELDAWLMKQGRVVERALEVVIADIRLFHKL